MITGNRHVSEDINLKWTLGAMLFCGVMVSGTLDSGISAQTQDSGTSRSEKQELVTIPISALNVDQAIATVSVLQEPRSAVRTILDVCRSGIPKALQENFQLDEEGLEEEIKKICNLVERFTGRPMKKPALDLNPKEYFISVPLNAPRQEILAVVWVTHSLEEAITVVDVLQSGKLQAVKVYARIPWSSPPDQPCSECPIKELVFQAKNMKEPMEILRGKSNEH